MDSRFLGALALSACLTFPEIALGAFGLTESGGRYTIDTGAGLVFKVNQANGDITSLNFNGIEYQDSRRFSQINSGLGSAVVTGTIYGDSYIKITVTAGTLIHYYLARNGDANIYMATYFSQEPSIGLVRYIVRIPSILLPNGPIPSDIRGNVGIVEAQDIFRMDDGTTRSKHYSNGRLLDWSFTGATGLGVGVFMVRSNHEGDSGGPFYRCLINQCGEDQELYEIVNYGEAQTEPFRLNMLNGPYALVFTDGSEPVVPLNTAWISGLGLQGYVDRSDRGYAIGSVLGIPDGFQAVVGFANAGAQYWSIVSNGNYTSPRMIPGVYTATLYKGELAVSSTSVSVLRSAKPVTLDLQSEESAPSLIWRIGDWDGTPAGMLNADLVTYMHPSDVRMSWSPVSFTVGVDPVGNFPCYQWKDINNPTTIYFELTPDQVAAHTLRIGITAAYAGGRPLVSLNSWTSGIPGPSNQPRTRMLTVGTYRGNNTTYTYRIPESAFIAGTNTLVLTVVSGSGGTGFLSPGYSYDAVELDD